MKDQKIFIKRFVKHPKVAYVKVDGEMIITSKKVFEGDKYEGLAKRGKFLEMEPRIAYISIPEGDSDMLAILQAIEVDGEEAAIKKFGEESVDAAYAFAETQEQREQEEAEAKEKAEAEAAKEKAEILDFIAEAGENGIALAIEKYGNEKVALATAVTPDTEAGDSTDGEDGSGDSSPETDSSLPPGGVPTPINPPPPGKKHGDKKEGKPGLIKRALNKVKGKKSKGKK